MAALKPCLLTGDTPTGQLHLGHWVGSLENRVRLQNDYNCYFIIANSHAFTTRVERPADIRQSVLDITLDYLSCGLDPEKSALFVESDVPAIFELATYFSMLLPFSRVMRNPTIKDEIRDKELGDNYSFGFLLYPVLQVADILAFRADVVPVGEDQIPHLEMTREVARKFNQLYCGVNSHAPDEDQLKEGGLFPILKPLIGRGNRLVGTGSPGKNGKLLKMSKSLNNAIMLTDNADTVRQKVMSLYTDPRRLKATDPGTIENNPLWIFHDAFNPDKKWVEESKIKYQAGNIGDVECKKKLIEVLVELLTSFQARRKQFEKDPGLILNILKKGAERANAVADETLRQVKEAIHQIF